MQLFLQALREILPEGRIEMNVPMARLTTFRIGGPADIVARPASEAEAVAVLRLAESSRVPAVVLGNGSNVIVRDGGIRGLVVLLGEDLANISVDGCRITAEAGAPLSRVAQAALGAGLAGLEFASGLPGSVGGACVMNAGAYDGQLRDVLIQARVYHASEVRTWKKAEMEMGYRTSRPLREGGIVLSAVFELREGDREAIGGLMRDLNNRRREKQPLNMPSAGSVFKRPVGLFAGRLIEDAGLKGFSIGGAQVSEKHAGFIVNTGNATAADVLALIAEVQRRVYASSGISLETEVRVLGE
ncbi:MAG: UDP-N-acetylmuramate dehydrogenase [Clostridia bacterium]|nr:UDP-N-acetylmuramate dehydrogenase [Clostridia bacterium]